MWWKGGRIIIRKNKVLFFLMWWPSSHSVDSDHHPQAYGVQMSRRVSIDPKQLTYTYIYTCKVPIIIIIITIIR